MSVFGRLLPRISYCFCVNYKIMSNYVDIIVDKEDNCSGIRINFSRGNHCKYIQRITKALGRAEARSSCHGDGDRISEVLRPLLILPVTLPSHSRLMILLSSTIRRRPSCFRWAASQPCVPGALLHQLADKPLLVLRGIYRDYPQIGK